MRNLGNITKDAILKLHSFDYCFKITLTDKRILFFTSADKVIKLDDNYLPNSGISLIEGVFNDCANDHIILEGIFEENGINDIMDLTGAEIKIQIYFPEHLYDFITYYCTLYTKYDLHFSIYLESESIKYNQSLLNVFSETCRADFADKKCRVDKHTYSKKYDILEIMIKTIIVSNIDYENGYFIGGSAILGEEEFKSKILNSFNNQIELDKVVPEHMRGYKNIILIAGCDKKFRTCCNKFDNAVNFRGEPLIPKYNFLNIIL